MSQYLFLFTIGPVQSFIAQARKTQDLNAGSYLLSHLVESTMHELKSTMHELIFKMDCEFIFPNKEIESKPNRFIAIVKSDNIEKLGNKLKGFAEREFENIANNILNELNGNISDSFKQSFQKQVKSHLQLNWVALPLEGNKYIDTYKELESYLGAIKNVQSFQQLEEKGRKCSLCGERNVLFYRLTNRERRSGGLKRRKDNNLQKLFVKGYNIFFFEPKKGIDNLKMHKGEGLCAICFAKRFADKFFGKGYGKYPSTAEIALMDSLNNLDQNLLDEYRKIFGDNFDEELYYKDNLTKSYFDKNNYSLEKLEDAKAKYNQIAQENKLEFSKYYAVLMLDGDSMGQWLSGEFLADKTQLLNFHKKLTFELGDYAKKVKDIIKEPKGRLVYAGGDDVLAFINLNHLLPTIKKLREEFPEFEKFGFKVIDNQRSSASAGIVIAHYKTPLSEVLKWVRKMEDEAKSIDDQKDAFAIAVLKHSGQIRKTLLKWQYNNSSPIEILGYLIELLERNKISNKFIKNLRFEFKRLADEYESSTNEDKPDICGNEKFINVEIKRLINRSCMMTREQNETEEEFLQNKKEIINDLTAKLYLLYTNSKSLDNFLSSLDIADFIKRRGN